MTGFYSNNDSRRGDFGDRSEGHALLEQIIAFQFITRISENRRKGRKNRRSGIHCSKKATSIILILGQFCWFQLDLEQVLLLSQPAV